MERVKGREFAPSQPKELGAYLRRERESRGWSISIAVHSTKLTKSYIEAIEAGDFNVLPGGLFNKTFVHIYARELGIPKTTLNKFYNSPSEALAARPELAINHVAPIPAAQSPVRPPKFAEYLLYFFLTHRERISLIGDTEEEYREVLEKFGRLRADAWYYKQVFDSLRPLVWRSVTKLRTVAWTAKYLGWIYEFFQHLFKDIFK